MNELNFASLRASKKLVDNGIVLSEVDFMWFEHEVGEWILMSSDSVSIKAFKDGHAYPAPCFTDVWRELPWVIDNYGLISMNKVDNITCCGYRKGMAIREPKFESENPTDALIDLLVWLKGAGK